MVCTGCCATLDNIVTYLFKKLTKKSKKPPHPTHQQDSEAFLRILELHPEILQQASNQSTTASRWGRKLPQQLWPWPCDLDLRPLTSVTLTLVTLTFLILGSKLEFLHFWHCSWPLTYKLDFRIRLRYDGPLCVCSVSPNGSACRALTDRHIYKDRCYWHCTENITSSANTRAER